VRYFGVPAHDNVTEPRWGDHPGTSYERAALRDSVPVIPLTGTVMGRSYYSGEGKIARRTGIPRSSRMRSECTRWSGMGTSLPQVMSPS